MAASKGEAASTEAVSPAKEEAPTNIDAPSRQVVRSFVPPQRDPADFTKPGLEQGFYPGDPNLYQDPEKMERSY
jgi:hypothetical protein